MDPAIKRKLELAIGSLDRWVEDRQWKGFDPYDLRGIRLSLWAMNPSRQSFLPAKLVRGGISVLEEYFPLYSRRLMGVHPTYNAKAMGLFASAYLGLYRAGCGDMYLQKATSCLEWLEANTSPGYSGPCWGYPFDWQSTVLIPKGTPSSVVSWTVGDAFWSAYEITKEPRYLRICRGICDFFVQDLNRDSSAPDHLCFSYTPLDRMHVFNASLFVGEFLLRVGLKLGEGTLIQDGLASANYVLAHQSEDGSWPYFGPEDHRPNSTDHYHTGFVLRMLLSMARHTQDPRFEMPLERGIDYYRTHLFEVTGLPRYFPDKTFPINIHTISEALLCLNLLSKKFPEDVQKISFLLNWTFENMQDPEGYFYFMKYPTRTIKIPFMRWGQAWMLLALSEIYLHASSNGD